jgi:tetratricopeptide (TPR) repeat protein
MTEDKIKNLLQEADRRAGLPRPVSANLSAIVRHRAHRRHLLISLTAPMAAAAVILIAAGIWNLTIRTHDKTEDPEKIVLLERQLAQLQARTDAAINLIQEVLVAEQKKQSLGELEAQLASIPDPLEEIQRQVDKTASILVYQADRLYRELNRTDSAVETYYRVIELSPKSRWAQQARQRLLEIESRKFNKEDSIGELKWKPQVVSSSSSC